MARILRIAAACIALSAPLLANAQDAHATVERQTRFGPIVGSDDSATNGTYSWKGVPFAKPPVGDLRWRPPVDPEGWKAPRAATSFGNACAQYGRIYGPGANNRYDETIGTTLNTPVGHEDCLYLNIWRPAAPRAGLPVIVFVHGGSNVSGYTADPIYDGAALARTADAVVVTVNYRLGIFGFLNQPALKTGNDPVADSGNFALLDIVKALEFVQGDIAKFGGNPHNVTLMGQSAGAINVWALLASPLVMQHHPQLFQRAVPLSGGLSLAANLPPGSVPTLNPASIALLQGNALLRQQLIADGTVADAAAADAWIASHGAADTAAYLRSRSASSLLTTLLFRLAGLGLGGSGPIPDGTVLATNPVESIRAGQYVRVPVLAGNTRDEAKLFPTFLPLVGGPVGRLVTDAQLFNIQFHTDPENAATTTLAQWIHPALLPVDTPVTGFNARTDLLNQRFFLASRDNILNALRTRQDNIWYYRFDWDEQPAPWNDIYGAAHLYDLPFIFGTFGPSLFGNVAFTQANAPGRLALSQAMMKSLGAFARVGDPNAPSELGVAWPTWPSTLVFDATKTQKAITVE
jgi:para-nitrobenzyl esterase